ncbi:MAG: response regulator [Oscillospiraceae bacterium]|nr:response regulator [Oscillospiraceae bacterium]
MNTILIAEDEKFIRRGLKTMIERSPVPTGEILEARDGEEALELLRARPVDLLVTDIRMPRMDGIELVSQLGNLDHQPMVLVVSGYDDFSYAVEMLRSGAQDYLLKPVERERLYQALEKLEERYRKEQTAREEQERQFYHALRQLMLESLRDEERQKLLEKVRERFFAGPYVGFCSGTVEQPVPEGVLCLRGAGTAVLYAVREEYMEQLLPLLPCPLGRSAVHQGAEGLYDCYQEARSAWERSFFTGTLCVGPVRPGNRAPAADARQLAGLVGLSRGQEASRLLAAEAGSAARGETAPDAFARLCADFVRQLHASYRNILAMDGEVERFADIWDFPSCARYLEELGQWLDLLCGQAAQEFSDYENKQKIRQAVQYIQQNFRQPLNMAQVSNHVSMNYSLFSLLFKQYTGSNFVSYMQKLRLDEAKRLLKTTDWLVNEIGRRAGFADEKRFLKVFKASVGLSPTEYRKSALLLGEDAPGDES